MKFSWEGTITILTQNIIDNFTINKELIYKNKIQNLNIQNKNENLPH